MACHNAQAKSRYIDARRRKAYSTHGQRLLPLWRGVPRIMITILPISFYFFFPLFRTFHVSVIPSRDFCSQSTCRAGNEWRWHLLTIGLVKPLQNANSAQRQDKGVAMPKSAATLWVGSTVLALVLVCCSCLARATNSSRKLKALWFGYILFSTLSIGSGLLTWLHVASTTFTKKSVGLISDLRLLL